MALGGREEHDRGQQSEQPRPPAHVLTEYAVCIFRIVATISHGTSNVESVEYASINTKGWELLDLKFADDNDLALAMLKDCT